MLSSVLHVTMFTKDDTIQVDCSDDCTSWTGVSTIDRGASVALVNGVAGAKWTTLCPGDTQGTNADEVPCPLLIVGGKILIMV